MTTNADAAAVLGDRLYLNHVGNVSTTHTTRQSSSGALRRIQAGATEPRLDVLAALARSRADATLSASVGG
jgi:hypothetical protein